MTTEERKIADYLEKNYDEIEESYPFLDFRFYLANKFNGIIASQDERTDALLVRYSKDEESQKEFIQIFISSDDDMNQDWVSLSDLTEAEQKKFIELFFETEGIE